MFAATALCMTGCGAPSGSSSSATSAPSASVAPLNPARIDRARADLPAGYEVADVAGRIAPVSQWGFGPGWSAEPPQCSALADPAPEPTTSKGWSGSGPGGIVYAVVAGSPPQRVSLDPAIVADCGRWMVEGGRTTASVTVTTGPAIYGVATVAMSAVATSVVEGGTETRSRADTVTAYVDEYAVFVTVVTDPGSPNPQLGPDFAATLIAKSVAALRG